MRMRGMTGILCFHLLFQEGRRGKVVDGSVCCCLSVPWLGINCYGLMDIGMPELDHVNKNTTFSGVSGYKFVIRTGIHTP